MADILITGGAGFIGSHTARALLQHGHRVRVLDNLSAQIHGEGADWPVHLDTRVERLRGDVTDPATCRLALEDIEVVYHFAAETGVGQSMYDMRQYTHTNVTGTATLLEAALGRARPPRRLILASSRAVYGEGQYACPVHGQVKPADRTRAALDAGDFSLRCPHCASPLSPGPTPENHPLRPLSVYGWTKKHQEDLCLLAAASHSLDVVLLRYFNVYGSLQSLHNPYTGVVTIFFNRLRAGQPIHLYEQGLPLRDFVHVRDVVQANILALERELPSGSVFNVGSGSACPIAEVAEALAEALGLTARLVPGNAYRVGDIFACTADLGHSREVLGYTPRIGLQEGMREFTAWALTQQGRDDYDRTVEELRRHGLFGGGTS